MEISKKKPCYFSQHVRGILEKVKQSLTGALENNCFDKSIEITKESRVQY